MGSFIGGLWCAEFLESFLEETFESLQGFAFLFGGELFVGDDGFDVEISTGLVSKRGGEKRSGQIVAVVRLVPGWHEMVVVHELEEWLNLESLFDLFLRHSLGHLSWATGDTGDEAVSEVSVLLHKETMAMMKVQRVWGWMDTLVPSSKFLITTAFLPANRPERRMTILPYLMLIEEGRKWISLKVADDGVSYNFPMECVCCALISIFSRLF